MKLHKPEADFRPAGSVDRATTAPDWSATRTGVPLRCRERPPDRLTRPAHLDIAPRILAGAEGLVDLHLDGKLVLAGDELTTAACPGVVCEALGRGPNIRTPTITARAITITLPTARAMTPTGTRGGGSIPVQDGRGGRDERDAGVGPEVGQCPPRVHATPAGRAEAPRRRDGRPAVLAG